MLSVTYREVKSRFSEELLLRLSEYCAESGLSQSEVIRRAVDQFIGQEPCEQIMPNTPTNFNGPDDPSNPLG